MNNLIESKKAEDFLKEPYARLLVPNDDGTFTAEMLEFPGCIAEGDTADEAIRNLEKAAKGWIQASLEQGREIPLPCTDYNHSGRIALRLPVSLHRQAATLAQREGTSLNQFLLTSIAARVGASDLYNRLVKSITVLADSAMTITNTNTNVVINITADLSTMSTLLDRSTTETIVIGETRNSRILAPAEVPHG